MAFGGGNVIGEVAVRVRPDVSGFKAQTHSGVLGSIKGLAGPVGAAFAAVGIGRFIGDTVKAGATFDTTLRQMAAVADVPKAQLKSLSDLALKMGADTSFSAQQAAEAMLELSKGGISAAQIKAGVLASTLTLAAAGGVELSEAATFMSNALNGFGLSAGQAGDVAAALAGGANASTASVESLGQALSQVGPGAKNAGLSLQDTVGVLAAFDQAGIKGSDAGTSLKTMLTRLVPSTNKAKAAMADLGLKFTDAKGAFLPVTKIAQQLQDGLKGLTAEQKSAALATIFGSDATRAASVLAEQGAAGLAKYIKATKDRGAAEEAAKARTEGAAGAMEQLRGAFETIQIQLAQRFLPGIAKAATFLARNLPGAFTAVSGAIGGVVGFLQSLGARLAPTFQTVARVIGEMAKAVIPAAVAFGQALLPALRSLFNTFKNDVLPVLKAVGIVIGVVLFVAITKLLPVVLRLAGPVLGAVLRVTGFLITRVFAFINTVGRLVASFLMWATGTKTVGAALTVMAGRAAVAFGRIVGAARIMLSIILGAFSGILHGAATAFGWVPGIGPKLKAAAAKFDGFKDAVLGALEATAAQAGAWGSALGNNYAAGIQSKIAKVRGSALAIANVVKANMRTSSPAEEGPLSLDGGPGRWGERLGVSFAKGLAASAGRVGAAAGLLGGQAIPGVTMPRRQVAPAPAAAAGAGGAGVTQHFTLVQQPGQSTPAYLQQAMFAARTQARPA